MTSPDKSVCLDCGRRVRQSHADCDGDARATCSIYGCGDLIAVWREVEISGDGRTIHLGYCEEHR